ncbi:hypothetical protein ES708_06641 [subsurface metagenome]
MKLKGKVALITGGGTGIGATSPYFIIISKSDALCDPTDLSPTHSSGITG